MCFGRERDSREFGLEPIPKIFKEFGCFLRGITKGARLIKMKKGFQGFRYVILVVLLAELIVFSQTIHKQNTNPIARLWIPESLFLVNTSNTEQDFQVVFLKNSSQRVVSESW